MISQATIDRIGRIDRICNEMTRMQELYSPLAQFLMPIRRKYMERGGPVADLRITLEASRWQKQFKAGVDRCVGFNIDWRAA